MCNLWWAVRAAVRAWWAAPVTSTAAATITDHAIDRWWGTMPSSALGTVGAPYRYGGTIAYGARQYLGDLNTLEMNGDFLPSGYFVPLYPDERRVLLLRTAAFERDHPAQAKRASDAQAGDYYYIEWPTPPSPAVPRGEPDSFYRPLKRPKP